MVEKGGGIQNGRWMTNLMIENGEGGKNNDSVLWEMQVHICWHGAQTVQAWPNTESAG